MEIKPELAAYFAGIFDGEGCAGVYKRKRGKYQRFDVQVSIKMTNPNVIKLLKIIYGGNILIIAQNENRKKSFTWSVGSRKAVIFLKSILFYLKVKGEQAVLCINFYENLVSLSNRLHKTPNDMIEAKEKILSEFRKLNKRGVKNE